MQSFSSSVKINQGEGFVECEYAKKVCQNVCLDIPY